MPSPLAEYLQSNPAPRTQLHLGCGGKRWEDFVNVDLHPAVEGVADSSRDGCVADVFADIRALELPDACVDEIFTSHVLEHFPRWQTIDMLTDWHRSLKPGARLVVEMPDFWRCVLWLFHPRSKRRRQGRIQFYGNHWDRLDFETHRYVWSASEFRRVLLEIGFARVEVSHRTQTHHPGRDMRVTAYKTSLVQR